MIVPATLLVLLAPCLVRAVAPAAYLREVRVAADRVVGELRSLQGVNGAPGPNAHKPEYFTFGGWNMSQTADASAGYRWAAIDLVRTHDAYGPTDIDARFGAPGQPDGGLIHADRDAYTIWPRADADPEDPASYRFASSDATVRSILGAGARVLYRLGRSEGSVTRPPDDPQVYARIVAHIVRHYSAGWDQGMQGAVREWEVWNEPDLGKLFWGGTPEQFFELYAAIARAVRASDPGARVGGPALAKPNDASAWRERFMDFVRARGLPLDFYSWHWYATDSGDPMDFVRIARNVRALLDAHGLRTTRSYLTEWNYGLVTPPPDSLLRAAFVASSLIYMQDAPVDAANLYRADNLFGSDGATPDKTGQALILTGRMRRTPVRLEGVGADHDGFAVTAGRSADGREYQVLVSNYEIPPEYRGPRTHEDVLHVPPEFDVQLLPRRSIRYRNNAGFALRLAGLPPGRRYVLRRCRITAQDDLGRSDTVAPFAGTVLRIREALPAPGIELLSLQAVDAAHPAPAGDCRTGPG